MIEFFRTLLNLPPGGSDLAREVDLLHMCVIGVSLLGAFGVGLTTLWFVFRYRARRPMQRTARLVAPRWLELGVAGVIVCLFVGWWVYGFRQYLTMQRPPRDTYDITVVGKQWMWKFWHERGQSSAGVLVAPANRPVRLVLTSRDVIHSFFVPALRLKADALPQRYTSLWFEASPATHPVFCAEYCGLSHSSMRAALVLLDAPAFERYRRGEDVPEVAAAIRSLQEDGATVSVSSLAEDMRVKGKRLAADYGCLSCHVDTTGAASETAARTEDQTSIGPSWIGLYGSERVMADGHHRTADEQYLRRAIIDPQGEVVRGYRNVMPTYLGQMTPDRELAIIAYIRSLAEPKHDVHGSISP